MFNFDSKLLEAPKILKEYVNQYQQKKQVLDKNRNNDKIKHSFLDNYIMDIFLFIAAILSVIATAAIVHLICKHAQLKALLTGIAFQPVGQTEAMFGSNNESGHCKCTAQWYTIAALASMIIGLIIFILITARKCRIFRGKLFSNTVTVMLFFSDIKQYVPVKLCKTAGNIHLFTIFGQLTPDQITLERKLLWDIVKIDWKEERSLYDFEWNFTTFT